MSSLFEEMQADRKPKEMKPDRKPMNAIVVHIQMPQRREDVQYRMSSLFEHMQPDQRPIERNFTSGCTIQMPQGHEDHAWPSGKKRPFLGQEWPF